MFDIAGSIAPVHRTRKRDTQKSKLYRAEDVAFPEYKHTGRKAKGVDGLRSITECNVWVGRVLLNTKAREACRKVAFAFAIQDDDKTIHDFYRWPSRVTVDDSRGVGGARAVGSGRIEVSAYFRNPLVLLHELAHLVAPAGEGHGPVYAGLYLALVRVVMGVRAHDKLRDAFKARRVRYKPKRTLSPERKAALVEQLARARNKSPIQMSDEEYADHVAAKRDGADNIDDPRVLRFVLNRQTAQLKAAAIAIANIDGSYT